MADVVLLLALPLTGMEMQN
jgi:hypothetical protein